MSDQVDLNAYGEEIDNHVRAGQYDEAIALCQHVLSYYPKHIDTYRQMGQANLAKGDHQNAQELFRRVLSADPENSVAYTGLAITFENQGVIDEAIWHLERAFELDPLNLDIRRELARLYVERDGRAPSRLKLTPGGLARLYLREGLFAQAVQEFRALTAGSPRRLDARVGLAESLWHSGNGRDSAQVAQELLQTLPFCLKANLIVGAVLQESGLEDSEDYVRCAEALDPRNRVALELLGDKSPLQPAEVLIPEYVEGAPRISYETEAEEPVQAGEFAEWFSEAAGEGEPEGPTAERQSTFEPDSLPELGNVDQVAPIQWSETLDTDSLPEHTEVFPSALAEEPPVSPVSPPAEISAELESQPAEEQSSRPDVYADLPPWLREAEGTTSPPPVPDATPRPTVPIESGLPAWLTEFQKSHQAEMPAKNKVEKKSEEKTNDPADDSSVSPLPPWLMEPAEAAKSPTAPPALATEAPMTDATSDWTVLPLPPTAQADLSTLQESGPEGVALEETARAETTITEQEPRNALESETTALESEAETGTTTLDDIPASSLGQVRDASSELPDWLKDLGTEPGPTTIVPPPQVPSDQMLEVPDWLKDLRSSTVLPTADATGEQGLPPTAQETAEEQEMEPAVEFEAETPLDAPLESPLSAQAPPWEETLPSEEAQSAMEAPFASEAPFAELPPVADTAPLEEAVPLQEETPLRDIPPLSWTQDDRAIESETTPADSDLELGERETRTSEAPAASMWVSIPESPTTELPSEQAAAEDLASIDPLADQPSVSHQAPGELRADESLPMEESPAATQAPSMGTMRRREPKGYDRLLQARICRDANRLGEALKEYDQIVQRTPRLVNHVIKDLQELILRADVPLEAHRILGDAYTRADRLADALERYRYVLERVS